MLKYSLKGNNLYYFTKFQEELLFQNNSMVRTISNVEEEVSF
jgi:hypothetical protein